MVNFVFNNNNWYQSLRAITINQVVMVIIAGVLCVGSVFGYRWYTMHTKRVAYEALTATIASYKAIVSSHDQAALLAFADQAGKDAARFNSSFNYYFTKFQANALIQAGKKEEGLALMKTMVDGMSIDAPLYFLFKTEYAILLLDVQDPLVREKAITILQEVAHNNRNGYPEMALFYLGRYYWSQGVDDQARIVWGELLQTQHDALVPSVWAQQAEILLAQLP